MHIISTIPETQGIVANDVTIYQIGDRIVLSITVAGAGCVVRVSWPANMGADDTDAVRIDRVPAHTRRAS